MPNLMLVETVYIKIEVKVRALRLFMIYTFFSLLAALRLIKGE